MKLIKSFFFDQRSVSMYLTIVTNNNASYNSIVTNEVDIYAIERELDLNSGFFWWIKVVVRKKYLGNLISRERGEANQILAKEENEPLIPSFQGNNFPSRANDFVGAIPLVNFFVNIIFLFACYDSLHFMSSLKKPKKLMLLFTCRIVGGLVLWFRYLTQSFKLRKNLFIFYGDIIYVQICTRLIIPPRVTIKP